MSETEFGTTEEYIKALEGVISVGLAEKHLEMLKAHEAATDHTVTWAELAEAVGYPDFRTVNLQYGTFARRIAEYLGVNEPPNDFWLNVLADWASDVETESGHQAFVLRRPVVEAMQELGLCTKQNTV
jgi:hypothetical protein